MNTAEATDTHSKFEKIIITIAVMLVAIIEVLDTTIVNVALPNMMGALGANADQISWVITSYIVTAAICMLLTGYCVTRFGSKKLLLVNIGGFLISSMLCGLSTNLTQIVAFRILQGMFGAMLVPMSQYILRSLFPLEKQGQAMAIWGIGIMVAPILGPTLGGIITDSMSWRWVFYINVPISLIAFIMVLQFVHGAEGKKIKTDFLGLVLMAVGVGGLQLFLDRGNQNNWFDSDTIIILFILSIACLSIFITRGLLIKDNIINLRLFSDWNLSSGTIILSFYCLCVMGIIIVQPIMLETLLNYSPTAAGLITAPRGIACAIGMVITSKIINHVDPRKIVCFGLLCSAAGSMTMSHFSLAVNSYWIVVSCSIQGIGMGFVFIPLSIIALATLQKDQLAEASGLFSFGRSFGSSVGISIFATYITRLSQIHWNRLSGYIDPSNPALQQWLSDTQLTLSDPLTPQVLSFELRRQATMIAYINCFYASTIIFFCLIPVLLLLKKTDPSMDNMSPTPQQKMQTKASIDTR